MTEPAAVICPHCRQPIRERYCGHCGERRPEPLRLGHLLGPSLEQIGQLDGPIGRTLLQLARSPSTLLLAYWQGERSHVSHPLKLLFWSATLLIAALTFSGLFEKVTLVDPNAREWMSLVLALNNYMVFLYLLPPAVLARWLLTPRRRIIEWYVALAFLTALSNLLKTLILPIAYLAPDPAFWFHRLLPPMLIAWALFPLLQGHAARRIGSAALVYGAYFLMSISGNALIIAIGVAVEAWWQAR